jgi:ribosome biogenesis protein BRX1
MEKTSKDKNSLKSELLAFDPSNTYDFPSEPQRAWKNRQRVLLVGSRGIKAKCRHLMTDLSKLLPHHKRETKIEKNQGVRTQLESSCEMKDCENILYFEQRGQRMYLYMGKSPSGPTIKFQLTGVSTAEELKLTGNCLKYSRPIISFDESFKEKESGNQIWSIFRRLAVDAFGTPKFHPKSQPFVDKVFHFGMSNGAVHFRNYQVRIFG